MKVEQQEPKEVLFSRVPSHYTQKLKYFTDKHTPAFHVIVFELTGTACYAFGCLVAVSPSTTADNFYRGMFSSLTIPVLLYCMFAWATIFSGAHFNPAVSLAFMLRRGHLRIAWPLGLIYMVCEIVGALFGTLMGTTLTIQFGRWMELLQRHPLPQDQPLTSGSVSSKKPSVHSF